MRRIDNPLRRGSVKSASPLAATVIALAALVAACGGDDGSATSAGGGGGSAKELLIGVPATLSGPAAAFGKPEADAAQMTADAINASGGIKELGGAKVKLIIEDTKSDPVTAGKVLREMAQQKVSAFVGPTISAESVANKPLIQSLKIPVFSPSIDSSLTKDNVNGYIFRMDQEIGSATKKTLDYVNGLIQNGTLTDVKRVGVVAFASPPGPQTIATLTAGLRKLGLETTSIKYDPSQVKDYAPLVEKLRSANVDLLMGQMYPNDGIQFAQAIGRSGWKPREGVFLTGGGTFLDVFKKEAGSAADNWVVAAYTSNLDSDTFTPETQKLAAEFKQKYNATMEGTSANLGSTGVALAVNAAAAAKSTDPQKVAAAARKLQFATPKDSPYPYYMMPGGVKYDQNQDNTALLMPLIQWKPDGSFTTVGPDEIKTGDYVPQTAQ
jgi:branched-chain amino acid transport system substrate-binding protein